VRILLLAITGLLLWAGGALLLDRYGARRAPAGPFDTVAVLGCRVLDDGRPSGALSRRTRAAVALWEEGLAPRLALTGGPRDGRPSEAAAAATVARELKVPDASLLLEEQSMNTEENARELARMIGDVPLLVVTDGYHVFRTERVFRRHFSEVAVVGSTPGPHLRLRGALREVIAVTLYGGLGWLGQREQRR